jgi:hypothetical protein
MKGGVMSDENTYGPQPVPPQAWYFLYTLVAVLGLLVAGWILKEI